MKKTIALMVILAIVCIPMLTGCGDTKVIKGVEYGTYGLLSKDDKKNPDIEYKVIWGNVIWGAILVETIVAPIYFFGFSLFEPVGEKSETGIKGQVIR